MNLVAIKNIILLIAFIAMSIQCNSQERLANKEENLKSQYGVDKLITLNQLSEAYLNINPKKSLRFAKQAVDLAEDVFKESNVLVDQELRYLQVDAYQNLGKANFYQEKYGSAKSNFNAAIKYAIEIDSIEQSMESEVYLEKLDSLTVAGIDTDDNLIQSTLKKIRFGKTVEDWTLSGQISVQKSAAERHEKNGNYLSAIKSYEKTINLLRDKGKPEEIAPLQKKIAELHTKLGQHEEALAYYQINEDLSKKLGDSTGANASKQQIDSLFTILNKKPTSLPRIKNFEFDSIETQNLETFKSLAERANEERDFENAIKYLQLYNELYEELTEEKRKAEIDSLDLQNKANQIRLLVQDNEISELELSQKENELEKQTRARNTFFAGSVLLLALLISLYLFYTSKKKNHRQLKLAYGDLENTQTKLVQAQESIKKLLGQQVSGEIAEALISSSDDHEKIEQKFVCIMFLDIRDFTPFAEKLQPEEIIEYQNKVFGFMIDAVNKYNGNINQFLGDGFMATFGAPISHGNDCQNAFDASREILSVLKHKNENGEIPKTQIGIGLHAGKVVTGNVGTELRKQYSITGNTVITASRIEQLNKTFSSQLVISEEVFNHLAQHQIDPDFKEVKIKGRNDPINVLAIS